MLPGARTDNGAIYVTQGPPPAGTPLVGGIAVSPLGVIYASQSVAPVFDPEDLFQNSEQGAWYDPSDLSTMFQDAAGTTPVTADGQPVGLIRDKSGRNNHASQATAAKRPLYKTDGTLHWLQFDGVNSALATASIDFTVTGNVTVFIGIDKLSDATVGTVFGIGDVNVNNRCLYIRAPGDIGTPTYRIGMKGPAWAEANGGIATAPVTNVITDIAQCAAPRQELRINAVSSVVNTDNPAMPTFGNLPIYIAETGSGMQYSNSHIYSLIALGRLATTQEITDTETWVANKTGISLP